MFFISTDSKHLYLMFALGGCFALGYFTEYMTHRNAILTYDRLPVIDDIEANLSEVKAESREIQKDDEGIVNAYLNAKYGRFFSYSPYSDSGIGNKIADSVNNNPSAQDTGFSISFNDHMGTFRLNVEPDSQAENCGLCCDDIIVAVDGAGIFEQGLDAVKGITGKDGTQCEVTVLRGNEIKTVVLTRRKIEDRDIADFESTMLGNVLYVRIGEFDWQCENKLGESLTENNYSAAVVDLRGNSGGNTDISGDMADLFVSSGNIALHSNRGAEFDRTIEMHADATDVNVPVAVLVNGDSASSSEIMAALLRKEGGAVLVGTTTTGKGTYINGGNMKDGMYYYLDGTYTISGMECFEGVGLVPDEYVAMNPSLIGTDKDVQLQKALDILDKSTNKKQ